MGKSLMSCFLTHRVYCAKDIGEMSVEAHNKEVQVVRKIFFDPSTVTQLRGYEHRDSRGRSTYTGALAER